MVTVKIGNLFESRAQTWVNTVNCVGIMGKGVALEFKKRFPDMFRDYERRCKAGQVQLGEPYLYAYLVDPWILNFPTKDHWRSLSSIAAIERGLEYLQAKHREWGIQSLAVPPLGCGEGQLEWRVVGPTLYRYLLALGIPVELYAPFGTPHQELTPEFLGSGCMDVGKYHIDPAWIATVEVLGRLETEPFRWPVGRIALQKLAYFGTVAGIPTGLQYHRGSYGPFAPDLKRRVTALMNNGLIREESPNGRMFVIRTGSTYSDARKAYREALDRWSDKIERVADLMLRMNSQQAEIAATVHFTATELAQKRGRPSEREILEEVMKWKQRRKPPLTEENVASAIRHLNLLGWISAEPDPTLIKDPDDILDGPDQLELQLVS